MAGGASQRKRGKQMMEGTKGEPNLGSTKLHFLQERLFLRM